MRIGPSVNTSWFLTLESEPYRPVSDRLFVAVVIALTVTAFGCILWSSWRVKKTRQQYLRSERRERERLRRVSERPMESVTAKEAPPEEKPGKKPPPAAPGPGHAKVGAPDILNREPDPEDWFFGDRVDTISGEWWMEDSPGLGTSPHRRGRAKLDTADNWPNMETPPAGLPQIPDFAAFEPPADPPKVGATATVVVGGPAVVPLSPSAVRSALKDGAMSQKALRDATGLPLGQLFTELNRLVMSEGSVVVVLADEANPVYALTELADRSGTAPRATEWAMINR